MLYTSEIGTLTLKYKECKNWYTGPDQLVHLLQISNKNSFNYCFYFNFLTKNYVVLEDNFVFFYSVRNNWVITLYDIMT
jgi:hypothetical protein